ncbi:MAG: O-antigen ligase family protein [Gammaproteobacteria bacterium]|nr:MAG: O-antigen ligase family protein [Gammaproteobacteria bacterium]
MNKTITSADRFVFYGFLVLFLWLPLPLGSNRSWAIGLMEVWVFLLSISWLILFFRGHVRFNSTFLTAVFPLIFFILFLVWVLFQSTPLPADLVALLSPESFSTYQNSYQTIGIKLNSIPLSLSSYNTYDKFLETLSYFLIFCLMLLLLKNTRRIRLFAGVIVLSGVFQAVYGSVMTLSGLEYSFFFEKEAYRDVATGTFVNRNHLAGYLEMCLAIGIGLLISSLHESNAVSWREFFQRLIHSILGTKIRLRIGLALMVIALVLSHSRMGNTAFFSSLTIMGIVYLLLVKKPPRSIIILFVSLLLIDVFIVGAWFGIDKVAQRLENTSASHETRDEVVRDTLTMIKDYPFTGTGGGTYDISFLRYRGHDISGFYNHAHNDYAEFLAEYGLIGVSFLFLLVMSSLMSALLALRKRKHILLKGMAFASSMGIFAILIHSTVDFNLQIPANASLFIALLVLGHISLHFKSRNG